MKHRLLFAMLSALVLVATAAAQDPGAAGVAAPQRPAFGPMGGGAMGMMDRGVLGTVTEVAADHYTVKTPLGDSYTVQFSSNTRFVKQTSGMGGAGYGRGRNGGSPPEPIQATAIKTGDAVTAMGSIDAAAKSVSALRVMLLDPETAQRMEQMEANFGKTWLQGKVTAINGTTIVLTGTLDHAAHNVAVDENTTFRRRRDPVTLADIQVGDMLRADGGVKDGVFTAAAIHDGGAIVAPRQNGSMGSPADAPPPPPQ